tara:strand:+ start:43 stop:549 length:507 start_codon:yes stop_codon:yes gene_type:complete
MSVYQLKIDKYIYTGSCKKIGNRMRNHRNNSINLNIKEYNIKLYKYIRNFGGWKNVLIMIIEENLNKEELKHVENYYDRTVPDNIRLNTYRVIPTKEERLEVKRKGRKKYLKNPINKLRKKLRNKLWGEKKIKCDICNIELRQNNYKIHLTSKKHIHNICIQENQKKN